MFESTLTAETREMMEKEAIKLMRMLRLDDFVINNFARKGEVFMSSGAMGGIYDLDDKLKNAVKDIETEHEVRIFHIIENQVFGMHCYSMLCVCKYPEEYGMNEEDVKDGYVFSYVLNVDTPDCSEFGSIVVSPTIAGGLRRIG